MAEPRRIARRNTNQRKAIRDVFLRTGRPLSTEEVLAAAQTQSPGLGIATVYRTLRVLVDEGWLQTVLLPGVPPRYELAGTPHHHYFYCHGCGRAFQVPGSLELLNAIVPDGFVLEHHDLVLHGRCASCAASES